MVLQKLGVNGTASAESIFHVMPESDTRFAQFPAKVHFPALIQRREIDQSGVDILHLAADLLDSVERALEIAPVRVFPRPKLEYALARRNHPAGERYLIRNTRQFPVGAFELAFAIDEGPEQTLYFRQRLFSFEQSEKTRHKVAFRLTGRRALSSPP